MQRKKIMIIGMGEVGTSHYNLLMDLADKLSLDGDDYNIFCRDKDVYPAIEAITNVDFMIIAIPYSDEFFKIVKDYESEYSPKYVNILSTVPPGTCKYLGVDKYTHSTTRGVHPKLEEGLTCIHKHIGGKDSEIWKKIYESVGIKCLIHSHAKTTELAHILNNCAYGVNLMLADELQKICRYYGVSYFEAVQIYTHSNNNGWREFGDMTKVRMILTPPNGNIGGHCVTMSADLLEEHIIKNGMIDKLKNYNGDYKFKSIYGYTGIPDDGKTIKTKLKNYNRG